MNLLTQGWNGTLKSKSWLLKIWPDGEVPLESPCSFIPREEGTPLCYKLDNTRCTPLQLERLAWELYQRWQPECSSPEEALEYIQNTGLPLQCDHFAAVWTADPKALASLTN